MKERTEQEWLDLYLKKATTARTYSPIAADRYVFCAVNWQPEGTRRRGRLKQTWLRTRQAEEGDRWNNIFDEEQDCQGWMTLVGSLWVNRRWRI